MKRTFDLDCHLASLSGSIAEIIGSDSKDELPYVRIELPEDQGCLFVRDKDLERFAVNILKALKSKHLKK